MKVNILGTEYEITYSNETTDKGLVGITGYCDSYSKKIVIDEEEVNENEQDSTEEFRKETLRHEIIHAFLSESGLKFNSNAWDGSWPKNEEMVDFFAIQFPKILKVFQEIRCI